MKGNDGLTTILLKMLKRMEVEPVIPFFAIKISIKSAWNQPSIKIGKEQRITFLIRSIGLLVVVIQQENKWTGWWWGVEIRCSMNVVVAAVVIVIVSVRCRLFDGSCWYRQTNHRVLRGLWRYIRSWSWLIKSRWINRILSYGQ